MRYQFQTGLLPGGWQQGLGLELKAGAIAALDAWGPAVGGELPKKAVLPGLTNLHSHAFQRGMAGLAERRSTNQDSFWSWREVMYRFLDHLTPDDCQAIAAMAYVEMLESGFTRVVEFHYLHHGVDGTPYADIAEMAGRIAAAAAETGIGLTLLPVLYSYGNFGQAEPSSGQRRFLNNRDAFQHLFDASRKHISDLPGAVLGVAPHSLRAVAPVDLAYLTGLAAHGPVHMHIAEQPREVADCLAWSGARPVQWLLENADVDGRWCLIHATHMTSTELSGLARTGAIAGLCPVTEANLGDGTFSAGEWLAAGGSYGIGTDSNVSIGLVQELQLLEYSQRLKTGARNVLADHHASTGRSLYERALAGGDQAGGAARNRLEANSVANFVSLDLNNPALLHRSNDAILDSWIFGNTRSTVWSVVANGVEVVSEGRHVKRDEVESAFDRCMQRLVAAL